MSLQEKNVSYFVRNSYTTLNECTTKTKNVWIVFHGIGFLSRYFLKYFDGLDPQENYLIAPQAPAKYYLNGEYKHVGASWLTKEQTSQEMENVLSYLDSVMKAETIPNQCKLIVFGYSQGVSIAARWVANRKIQCQHLLLYAGGIPNELTQNQFAFLKDNCQVQVIIGDKDEYLTEERMKAEKSKIDALFQGRAKLHIYDGGHELKKDIIQSLPWK